MMGLRLNEEQFDWVVEQLDIDWGDRTLDMLKAHYVDGIDRIELTNEYAVTRQFISSRFKRFENTLLALLESKGLEISFLIHKQTDVDRVLKFDVSQHKK